MKNAESMARTVPRERLWLLAGLAVLVVAVTLMLPPIPQDPAYHEFADRRTVLGVPNGLNVLSNLGFPVVGSLGIAFLVRDRSRGTGRAFLTPAERQPYWFLFAAVALTGIGSGYYHWRPDSATLFWDRLPMTMAFMALLSSVIAERINLTVGIRLLVPLVALGFLSTLYWHIGEQRGAGDLRPYAIVQFGTMVAVPLMIWLFPPRYTRTGDLFVALGWYALAKVFEFFDHGIFALIGVSGHTLKHLASAAGAWWIVRMIERRRPVEHPGPMPWRK
ncbi:MAG TPA: alkaline phytoceramidase [Candidatus Methylomirabilis sp.]|nr:alkaline phytoceramidase [Candidatus Methylomirabilis sp.]